MRCQKWSDITLRYQCFRRLAQGVHPFEMWATVFGASALIAFPEVRTKAFSVWFPTMLDYLAVEDHTACMLQEAARRRLDLGRVPSLCENLSKAYKVIVAQYSRAEQVFLTDRRTQDVHGVVRLSEWQPRHVVWYDAQSATLRREKVTPDDHRALLLSVGPRFLTLTRALLDRLLSSKEYVRLCQLFNQHLTPTRLAEIGRQLGVAGELTLD